MSAREKPLDGLLVVAIEQAVAAPLCSGKLADAGARVIKIERREGDLDRFCQRARGFAAMWSAWRTGP